MTEWRVIEYAENDAYTNMAIDEAVTEAVAKGTRPTIRFYGWKPSAVSIGYFQRIANEVDLERCREEGIDVIRRRTGGGAVYHDNYGEITYSVIGKQELFPSDILASYRVICGWIIDSLALLGLDCEFRPINDIVLNGKKISGNAQTRRNGVLLQHGTLLYSVDVERMFSLLKVPDEKIRDKLISSVKERVTSISLQRRVSREETYQALLEGFTKQKDYMVSELTPEEKSRALELVETRYLRPEWNMMR